MRRLLKAIIVLMLVLCLMLSGCTKNVVVDIYKIENNTLIVEQVQVDKRTPQEILSQLQVAGIVSNEVSVEAFESSGDDALRSIKINLSENFSPWVSLYEAKYQKLIMQSVANSYLHNYSANEITILSGGEAIKTSVYDFSGSFTYAPVNTDIDNIDVGVTPTAQVITPSPTPTQAPTKAPTKTSTPGVKVTQGPIKTPIRTDGKKYIALSFDDGPHKKYTKLIVDKLNEYNAKATFFVVGNRIDSTTSDAVRYLVEQGNEIAIHGYTHSVYYNTCSDSKFEYELSETAKVIKETTGVTPTLMRPIGGSITSERVKSCGYSVILWNVDSEDWRHKKQNQSEIDAIVNNVMKDVGDGKIILMHEIYENSYQALDIILRKLTEQGYNVVTVIELMGKENLTPGTKYFGAN